MSVIIITPDIVGPIKNGGIGTACFHYARTLANAQIPISVLFTGPMQNGTSEHWKSWYADLGITFITIDDLPVNAGHIYGTRWHSERSLRISEYLRSQSFRYILFQDWQANGFWSVRSKLLGIGFEQSTIGIITHSPNEWQKAGMETFGANPLDDAALEWEEREAIANADIVVSPSRHMVSWLTRNGYELSNQVAICPYTFEDEVAPSLADSVDRGHFIFFGRLETRKGLHLLGDALRLLKDEGRALPRKVSFLGKHASVLGEPSKDYLHRLFEDVPEIDYFVATDFDYVRAVNYIKEQNGVVIIASLLDNYPLTVIESITNGFSFIASRAGGIPEMVDESVVFEPTVSSLKDKILALPRISFGQLSHLYDPKLARDIWLSHVTAVIEPAIASPAVIETSSTAVSVCIPFYYADKYLPRLLTGFLRDADPNIQLVIVNDGTPEAECREFHRLKRKLEPIGHIFHSQENGGASRARNKAVELSQHEKLIFFDADNVPLPKMVMKLVNALLAANADSVSAPFFAVPPFIRQPLPTDVYWKYIAPGGPLVAAMLDNQLGDMCGIQRKDVFERLGGFDPNRSYYDDWKYFMKLVGYGYRHYVYPEPLFYYALDPQGRRSTESEYEKRMNLWDGLEAIPKEQLEKVLKVFVKDAYVKRPQQ